MSYDDDYEAQQRLDEEYEDLCRRCDQELERQERLDFDRGCCQQDVQRCISLLSGINKVVTPPLSTTATETEKEEVVAYNASLAIDDLVEKYKLLSNGSTASKNLTGYLEKYYTYYGLYNELRQVTLGYVVGLDKNFWQSDIPRQKVEKMYLANTDYWLAYAIMAVMLWASDEKEACERAVSKAMQIDERRSSLFFLLALLRFNRIDAAREWYRLYFEFVETEGLGEEIIYILQVLLSGALGADVAFAKTVQAKVRELLKETQSDITASRLAQESVDNYFAAFVSVTDKEFLDLKHICGEYNEMMALLSDAEKNRILKDYFESVINSDAPLSDRLSERIEDALYSLISAYDVDEQELHDKITYEEMVVKAKGDLKAAQESYEKFIADRKADKNLILIMINSVLNLKSKADMRVKKFSLDFIRGYCLEGASKFSQYRRREKKEYALEVDGCPLRGDENSFEANKAKLQSYYNGLIAARVKGDKKVKTLRLSAVLCAIACVVFGLVGSLGVAIPFLDGGQAAAMFVLMAIFLAGIVLSIYFGHAEKLKIAKSFEYRIANGMKMLEDGLKDMAAWRAAYHAADAVHEELIKVLKEEVTNG